MPMHDIKSNIKLQEALPAQSIAPGAVNGTAVDLSGFSNASFLISCGTVGASSTINAKIQYSDDGTTFFDAIASDIGAPLSPVAIPQKIAVFATTLHILKPIHRYYRVVVTVGVAASVVSSVAAFGGARHLPVVQP